jgi:hypothetical protein
MQERPTLTDSRRVYAISRLDLPQPHRTVQVAHAVLSATIAYGDHRARHPHPNLIVLAVADEAALDREFNRLKEQGIPCCAFYEEDLGNALTAVATGPLTGDRRRALRHLPLMPD